jgi:5'-nucleotidase
LRRTRLTLTATTAVTAAVVVGLPAVAEAAPQKPIPVQILAMNDFHGRISEAAATTSDAKLTAPGPDGQYGTADDTTEIVGGAADIATTVRQREQSFRDVAGPDAASYFVGAGDLVSASSFESGIFEDEPTIEVLNTMGLDASSVGNHEFDRGTRELRRISAATDGYEATQGGTVTACDPAVVTPGVDGCFGEGTHAFHGTDFPYLAANVVSTSTGQPILPPYQLFDVGGGRRIALIGVVTRTTPTIVSPDGVADVQFVDEADAVNRWTKVLVKQGVEAIGVLIHEGGTNTGADSLNPDGCASLNGAIVDINNRIDNQVDFIVSAHTHQMYDCLLPVPGSQPRLVTQAGFYGRLVSDIRLTVNSKSGDIIRDAAYSATNVPVTRANPDPTVKSIVQYWNDRAAEAGDVVVGSITADITRAFAGVDANGKPVENRGGESSLGNLVAQAQLEAMQQDQYGRPVVAFMNPGGLRTDLTYSANVGGEQPGQITYRELYNVQPFGNTVNAVTMTGAAIKDLLEQQFPNPGRTTQLILGTSEGFAYSYDLSKAYGSRISNITLNGVALDPATPYRVAMNSFLATGGDGFTAFTTGTDPVTGPVDVDTAVEYFQTHSSPTPPPAVSPPPANHGTQIG